LNSGHHRKGAYVLRAHVGKRGVRKTEQFSTFFPKAIALIGGLPSTLADRSIHIKLKRKLHSEKLQRSSLNQRQELNNLCRMAARWVADRLKYFSRYNPEAPASLNDRASDNWAPLLAIAELADELDLAKEAAIEIEAASEDGDLAVQLLGDCKRAFEDLRAEALPSKKIIEHIAVTGEGPWAEKPLTEKRFAEILRPLELRSEQKRLPRQKPKRLWFKASFEDAWNRYL
jgi:putative DNA primase/helicase